MGKYTHTHTHTHTHTLQTTALTSLRKHVSNNNIYGIVCKYYLLGVKNFVLYHSLEFVTLNL